MVCDGGPGTFCGCDGRQEENADGNPHADANADQDGNEDGNANRNGGP